MAYTQTNLVSDNSTLANFKSWAQAISTALSSFGWTQTADTGQVNWSTIAAVPGSNVQTVYEIWKPADGLTAFYLKISYGNGGGTNNPNIWTTLSTSTDGAGNPTGTVMGPWNSNGSGGLGGGSSTTYECNLSGDSGRFGVMMWRSAGAYPFVFAVERSINASGAHTSAYVSMFLVQSVETASGVSGMQQSMSLSGLGLAPMSTSRSYVTNPTGLIVRGFYPFVSTVSVVACGTGFDGLMAVDFATPCVGYFDFPCTMIGVAYAPDLLEGTPFSTYVYGTKHNYLPSKITNGITGANFTIGLNCAVFLRID